MSFHHGSFKLTMKSRTPKNCEYLQQNKISFVQIMFLDLTLTRYILQKKNWTNSSLRVCALLQSLTQNGKFNHGSGLIVDFSSPLNTILI